MAQGLNDTSPDTPDDEQQRTQDYRDAIAVATAYMSREFPPPRRKTRSQAKPSYLKRLQVAAEQLRGLATAKTDTYRQAQLASIDWELIGDEFDSVVGRYESAIERYAYKVIRELQSIAISYMASVEMELSMADLDEHAADFEPAEVDSAIAEVWTTLHDALAESRGIILALPPITSRVALRRAFEARQATHRALDRASYAYRDGWPVAVLDGVESVLAVAALPTDDKAAAVAADCGSSGWQSTWCVLRKTLRGRLSKAVSVQASLEPAMPLVAELAAALPAAIEQGLVAIKGANANEWHRTEIRRLQ